MESNIEKQKPTFHSLRNQNSAKYSIDSILVAHQIFLGESRIFEDFAMETICVQIFQSVYDEYLIMWFKIALLPFLKINS